MADENGEETQEKKGRGLKIPSGLTKMLVMILGLLVLISIAAVVSFAVGQYVRGAGRIGPDEPTGSGRGEVGEAPEIYSLGEFTAIPSDDQGRTYNLRLNINLAIDSRRENIPEITRDLTERREVVQDAVNNVLARVDPAEFIGRERPQAIANLKSQILRAVNENLRRQNQIDRVLFTEFIFQ